MTAIFSDERMEGTELCSGLFKKEGRDRLLVGIPFPNFEISPLSICCAGIVYKNRVIWVFCLINSLLCGETMPSRVRYYRSPAAP
jgi:hypothetical protein